MVRAGGLTLGGGYGVLSGQHSLAIDNLIGVEVVLANGEIVYADESQNSDLRKFPWDPAAFLTDSLQSGLVAALE